MLKQLKRIVYPVSDLARAKAWYSEILGFPPLFDAPFAAIFQVGNCSLSLAQSRQAEADLSARPVRDDQATATTAADSLVSARPNLDVYWEVDNVDDALALLLQHGATLHTPVAAMLNIRTARVTDPFGNILGLTDQGVPANRQTVDRKPSGTAVTVAFCRALAALEDRPSMRGPDDLAHLFLNVEAKPLLEQADRRRWAIANLVTSPLYGYFLARTAWFEEKFLEACRQRVPQIVLLGAGYDTRAIRHQQLLGKTRIFELDIATTQGNKLARLRAAAIVSPDNLIYVPIDFEKETIAEALEKSGYDPDQEALFLWEGVSYYLTRSSVEATLRFFQEKSSAGSSVAFDYMREELQSVQAAEPFRFWATPDELTAMLTSYGLEIDERLDTGEMVRRYLMGENGMPAEQCLGSFELVSAKVR